MATCKPITDSQAIVNSYNIANQSLTVSEINSMVDFQYNSFIIDRTIPSKEIYRFYLDLVLTGEIELTYTDTTLTTLLSGKKL